MNDATRSVGPLGATLSLETGPAESWSRDGHPTLVEHLLGAGLRAGHGGAGRDPLPVLGLPLVSPGSSPPVCVSPSLCSAPASRWTCSVSASGPLHLPFPPPGKLSGCLPPSPGSDAASPEMPSLTSFLSGLVLCVLTGRLAANRAQHQPWTHSPLSFPTLCLGFHLQTWLARPCPLSQGVETSPPPGSPPRLPQEESLPCEGSWAAINILKKKKKRLGCESSNKSFKPPIYPRPLRCPVP